MTLDRTPEKAPESSRYAVVTGASSGIGLEIARELVDRGYQVMVTAEDDQLETAARELSATGRGVEAVRADLTTREGVETLVHAASTAVWPVDVLVLNAGMAAPGRFVDTALQDDLDTVALNVTAVVHLAKKLIPEMVRRGEGRVLVTSSIAALMPAPYNALYAASKSFELSFAEALRHELKDTGVTVTALMPGPTDTEFFRANDMEDTPLGRGPKDDAAKVAKDAVDAMFAGKDKVVVHSFKAKAQAVLGSVLPLPAKAAVHGAVSKPDDVE